MFHTAAAKATNAHTAVHSCFAVSGGRSSEQRLHMISACPSTAILHVHSEWQPSVLQDSEESLASREIELQRENGWTLMTEDDRRDPYFVHRRAMAQLQLVHERLTGQLLPHAVLAKIVGMARIPAVAMVRVGGYANELYQLTQQETKLLQVKLPNLDVRITKAAFKVQAQPSACGMSDF